MSVCMNRTTKLANLIYSNALSLNFPPCYQVRETCRTLASLWVAFEKEDDRGFQVWAFRNFCETLNGVEKEMTEQGEA